MYADIDLIYPYFQKFSQDFQRLDELCYSQTPTSSLDQIVISDDSSITQTQDSAITTSTIGLGDEGDLFKAPEPIMEMEEPIVGLDPMTSAISLISCGDNIMPTSSFEVCDMVSLQNEQLFCDVFDGCRKELLEKTSIDIGVFDLLDIKHPIAMTHEVQNKPVKSLSELPFVKSGSSGSLSSMDMVSGSTMRPNFLDFPELDFGAAYGMRRAFSEGDIKALGDGNSSLIHSLQRPLVIGNCTAEDRLQKLSRYRNKKSRRNFGRKIKYACRKALADSQPRIRGRFAKTEETESCKKQ